MASKQLNFLNLARDLGVVGQNFALKFIDNGASYSLYVEDLTQAPTGPALPGQILATGIPVGAAGSGNVVGPASSTDNAIVRFDGATGLLIQDSVVIVGDTGNVSGIGTLGLSGAITFPDGVRQTFNPDGTTPGLNVGSQAGDPSTPSNGDIWYDSTGNLLRARINGATASLGAGGGANTALSNLASVAINLPLATGAGIVFAGSSTAPVATVGASQIGKALTLTASPAVASTDTAGAAAGGSLTLTAGAAARFTSGNANGGDINLVGGLGIGTGTAGNVIVTNANKVIVPAVLGTSGLFFAGDTNTGYGWRQAGTLSLLINSSEIVRIAGSIVNVFNATFDQTTAFGVQVSTGFTTELLPLNTGGVTTLTVGNLAPANAIIDAILIRITTTITTAVSFTVAVTGHGAFVMAGTATSVLVTLTAGTTYVLVPAVMADHYNAAATTLTVTASAPVGAGTIRMTVLYRSLTPPSS